jgi:hypothetical protein
MSAQPTHNLSLAELDRRSFDRFARGLDEAAASLRAEGIRRG